jgi:lipopolysaccharide cholinephosphotransferase
MGVDTNTSEKSSILRRLQLTELEILNEVVRICEKNKLQYFLIGGTLLGAIRHKGFIPWDDDLDIAMPREDYEKFILSSKNELSKEYWLHCSGTDPNYWLPFAKVRKKGTVFDEYNSRNIVANKGIYIDIFPLDNAKKEKSLFQSIQALLCKKLSSIILWKRGFFEGKPKIAINIILKIVKHKSLMELSTYQQKVMSIYKKSNSKYFVNLGSNYNYTKQTIPKDKYYPPVKVEFEGKLFNAPNDWDYILNRIYGDYMKLPPVEKRITHNPVRIKFQDGEEITF